MHLFINRMQSNRCVSVQIKEGSSAPNTDKVDTVQTRHNGFLKFVWRQIFYCS